MSRDPKTISLLLADVDGTLVTHEKVLTEKSKAAIAKLKEAGVRFAITSGRPPKGMEMVIKPLAIDTPDRRLQRRPLHQGRPDADRGTKDPCRRRACGDQDDRRRGARRLALRRQRLAHP